MLRLTQREPALLWRSPTVDATPFGQPCFSWRDGSADCDSWSISGRKKDPEKPL